MTMGEKQKLATRIFILEAMIEDAQYYPWPGKDFYENRLSEATSLYELLLGRPWEVDKYKYANPIKKEEQQ